jgi:glycosyltransferase involved in cell wall biosynthesis
LKQKKIKKPKISIVIPAFNSEKLLGRCIESALNQTLKEIEIIVIDDFSTDNTKSIIEKYAKKNSKVIGIYSKENRGAGYSRNLGIENASGEFVGFIDSDDFVDQEYYEYLYLNSKDKDIVHGIRVIHNFEISYRKIRTRPYGCIIPAIIRINFLIKNNLKFPTFKGRHEDSIFKLNLYKKKPRVEKVRDNGIYYHYVKREGSLSHYIKKE